MKILIILILQQLVMAKTVEVKMLNAGKDGMMVFEPGFLKIDKGDIVKFIPTDASHGSQSVVVPKGAKSWKGELNKSVLTTLTQDGIYIFQCEPHSSMGMAGVIQVGQPVNLEDAKKESKKLAEKFVTNKDRLDKYLGMVK
jgi:pseudoazurin